MWRRMQRVLDRTEDRLIVRMSPTTDCEAAMAVSGKAHRQSSLHEQYDH